MIGRTISHYTIVAELGRGGMGVVYRAEDARLDRSVAIKVLPPGVAGDAEAKDRFIQEARAASAFDHPNICTIHDIGETSEGELYLVMPVYEGGTLRDRMEAGPMEPETAVGFARQIASGLGRAHSKGIVHRDIKPDNLMVLEDHRLVILDFGVAKLAEGLDLTSQGSTIGTAAYMSPEQARGDSVDGRSDLWALGAILSEALTGRRPFPGSYDQAIIYGILNTDPEPMSGIPAGLEEVVARLLKKNPAERYANAEETLNALRAWEESGRVETKPAKRASRRPLAGAIAGVAVVVAAIILSTLVSRPDSIQPDPALAILPFQVQGSPDIAYLGDGIPTLLSTAIDGMGDLRAVDPLAVASFLSGRSLDVETAKDVAREFGAEGVVIGSATQLGEEIRLNATVYAPGGEPGETRTSIASTQSDLPQAVDELSRSLIADRFSGRGQSMAGLSAITSGSFEALREYLKGESQARSAQWGDAYVSFGRAIDLDSTFALALYRRASFVGWGGNSEENEHADIRGARRHSSGLPRRIRLMIDAQYAATHDSIWTSRSRWQEITDEYPDDAHALFRLADNLFHYNGYLGRSDREAIPLFRRALALDSSNVEVRAHMLNFALVEKDWAWTDSLFGGTDAIGGLNAAVVRAFARSTGTADSFFEQLRLTPPQSWEDVVNLGLHALEPEITIRAVDSLTVREPDHPNVGGWNIADHRNLMLLGRMDEALRSIQVAFDNSLWLVFNPLTYLERDHLTVDGSALQGFGPWSLSDGRLAQLIAQDALGRDDDATLSAALDTLRMVDTPASRFYTRSVQTLVALLEGDHEGALALAEETSAISGDGVAIDLGFQTAHVWPRWVRAELLFQDGQYEEAARWYATMHTRHSIVGQAEMVYAAPSHRRLAETADILGDFDEAIRQYELFLRYWYDVDPELQPAVDEARTRLDALLDARAAGGDVTK